jgi:hypothetical protein
VEVVPVGYHPVGVLDDGHVTDVGPLGAKGAAAGFGSAGGEAARGGLAAEPGLAVTLKFFFKSTRISATKAAYFTGA